MNPIAFVMRRPLMAMLLVVPLISGGLLALSMMEVIHFPPLNTPRVYAAVADVGAQVKEWKEYVLRQFESHSQ